MKKIVKSLYKAVPLKRQVFKLVKPLVKLSHETYQHLSFTGPINIKIDSQTSFKMYHHGYEVENDLFWAGFGQGWEGTSLKCWTAIAAQTNCVFDIGANTGVYGICAKAVNPKAQVFSFDPMKRIYDKLVQNIQLNGFDIVAVQKGVSNLTGTQTIYDTPDEHSYSASIGNKMCSDRDDLVEHTIETVSIGDFLEEASILAGALVKIDAERHEVEVLEGFGTLILEHKPTFLIEILDPEMGQRVEAFFPKTVYDYFEIIEGQGVSKVDVTGTRERNYIFSPKAESEKRHFENIV